MATGGVRVDLAMGGTDLGIIAGIVASEGATESYVAAAAGGLYVLTTTALPATAFLRRARWS
jgi:hypothetical protein